MTQETDQLLVRRLRNAYQCCNACGERYGTYKGGCSSWWRSVCDVCGLQNAVTETRDYGYLERALREMGVPVRY